MGGWVGYKTQKHQKEEKKPVAYGYMKRLPSLCLETTKLCIATKKSSSLYKTNNQIKITNILNQKNSILIEKQETYSMTRQPFFIFSLAIYVPEEFLVKGLEV